MIQIEYHIPGKIHISRGNSIPSIGEQVVIKSFANAIFEVDMVRHYPERNTVIVELLLKK